MTSKFPTRLAAAAIALALTGVGAAKADTILHFTFDSPTSYNFESNGGPNSVNGSFNYDATTQTFTNVYYDRGGDIFTIASASGPGGSDPSRQIFFGDTSTSDYDVYNFLNPLANGGTDTIIAATHPNIVIDAAGSITASASSAPEPASWALMLAGFGLVGAAVRSGRRQASTASA